MCIMRSGVFYLNLLAPAILSKLTHRIKIFLRINGKFIENTRNFKSQYISDYFNSFVT